MIRVGLTGGIGAGKSTVAKTFIDRGGYHVDADKIAREVVEPGTPGLAALAEAFGAEILADDGTLDRPALAAKAFVDDESRQKLNAITHPLIGARTQELLDAAPEDAIIIQDIPLLVENHTAPFFHLVVIVHVDAEERVRRLTEFRGMPEADARARIAAQATDEQRRAVADVWLDNSGTPEQLAVAAAAVWAERLVPFEANIRSRTPVRGPLTLADADPEWAAAGTRLVNRLWAVVGDKASAIDHIGSTAVPGLIAEPTIDIQVSVADLSVADALTDTLADGGFPRVPGVEGDNPKPDPATGSVGAGLWGKRLHASADPGRAVNVHLRAAGSPGGRFAVDFRDWLRDDAAARDEYAALKRQALDTADGDADRYVAGKEPWFDQAYRRIAAWKAGRGDNR
ncbi:dephospho-CoA kinase [Gordonia sp. NB41Y]|uniref:dephospho-CoA kinase n=1 Tax=Gordonia sp. NB41Y TaxID=875808 RepID=UPI00273B3981|nr:dephospho-CoA kinase [Gordonia sp. NB41Y]WLP90535.1 dephospho-CoA kinase [Gordonia sp. NB41Y]